MRVALQEVIRKPSANIMLRITFLCIISAIAFLLPTHRASAQYDMLTSENGDRFSSRGTPAPRDTASHKEIPRGITVWTVDEISGDRTPAVPDTMSYLRMNYLFASGIYGEYNTLGNNGSPRLLRIFTDRQRGSEFIFTNGYSQTIVEPGQFLFTNTYSPITNLDFNQCGNHMNGEDHLKAIFAVNASKQLGFGFKFDYLYARGYYANQSTSHFNYTLWGSYLGDRYQAHLLLSTNHQKEAENGGITNDEYITHPESFEDNFAENEIPTVLSDNWNRHDNQHIFFTHRYSIGFNRKVPMTEQEIEAKKFAMAAEKEKKEREAKEKAGSDSDDNESSSLRSRRKTAGDNASSAPAGRPDGAKIVGDEPAQQPTPADSTSTRIALTEEQARDSIAADVAKAEEDEFMKNEYVPVTSFFHTVRFDHYRRSYIAYSSPADYYLNDYYNLETDSINDRVRHTYLRNNLGISLLEGFNKWAKAGVKIFAAHELKHYALPELDGSFTTWNESNISVGGQLSKREGNTLHFDARGEVYVAGDQAGQLKLDGMLDVNIPMLGDTVRIDAAAFFHLTTPYAFMRRYQSRHFQWDVADTFNKESHTHIEGNITLPRYGTRLRIAADNITDYTYLSTTYNIDSDYNRTAVTVTPHQSSSIQVLTAQLYQNLSLGILHWDNIITWQKTSDSYVMPLPQLNIYSNLYLRFKIARVLQTDFGVDARYFTKYEAPEYSPQLQSYVVQENEAIRTTVGNYPICNLYANFQLKNCRFYILMSHINCSGKGEYFLTPHHPLNGRILRIGLNWNFFN